jgi:hypothetical protein
MINITNIGRMLLVSALVMAASGEASAQTGAPKDYAEAMKCGFRGMPISVPN